MMLAEDTQRIAHLREFAEEVGSSGAVCVRGGGTQWEVGRLPDGWSPAGKLLDGGLPGDGVPDGVVREVKAPSGVWQFAPADMVVRCGAGTSVSELNETLGEAGQMLPFDPWLDDTETTVSPTVPSPTVGGLLAVGQSGHRRLRYGPVRDFLLQVVFVNHRGELIRSGGPTVKNVSGFDLCKLMVGSLGTLGFIAEVILRCQPVPETSCWFSGTTSEIPTRLLTELWQPSSVLWNGEQVWVLLEGNPSDVATQAISPVAKSVGLTEYDAPPSFEFLRASSGADTNPQRLSLPPSALKRLPEFLPAGSFLAEVGVGIVHLQARLQVPASLLPEPCERSVELQREIKSRFDPTGRMNPGRCVWQA